MNRRNTITGGAPNQPFGQDARIFTLRHFPVSVGTTLTKLLRGSQRVPLVSIVASRNNSDFVTVGMGNLTLNAGFRQLAPGDGVELEGDNDMTRMLIQLADTPGEAWQPIELIDVGTFWGISNAGTQILMVTLGSRQPT